MRGEKNLGNARLAKKSLLYLVGNMCSKLVQFILIPLYAFAVTTEDLGEFDYLQTVSLIVAPILYVALWEAVLRFMLKKEYDENKIITCVIASTMVFSFLVVGIILFLNFIIPDMILYPGYYIGLILSYSIANVWQYLARSVQNSRIYVVSGIIGTITNLSINIILLLGFHLGMKAMFLGYLFGQIAITLTIECKLKFISRISLKKFDVKVIIQMIKFSAPLMLNVSVVYIVNNSGRIIVKSILGSQANGIYTFANRFASAVGTFGSVVAMAMIEEMILASKDKSISEYFMNTVQEIFKLFLSVMLLAMPVILIFYNFIASTDYYDSRLLVPYFLAYSVFSVMSTIIASVFQAIDKTKYIFITTIVGAFSIIGIGYFLVHRFGLYGVAIGQVCGTVIMYFIRYILVVDCMDSRLKYRPIIIIISYYALVSLVCIKSNIIIVCLVLALNIIITIFLNKSYISKIINYLKNYIKKARG